MAAGYAAQHINWRFPMYLVLIIAGAVFIIIAFFLPETLPGYILLKRAQRLRKLTGNPDLRSQSEIDQAGLTKKQLIEENLLLPFILCAEPAVFFGNLYLGIAYLIFYLFFESYPIVFGEIYHFSLGAQGLPCESKLRSEFDVIEDPNLRVGSLMMRLPKQCRSHKYCLFPFVSILSTSSHPLLLSFVPISPWYCCWSYCYLTSLPFLSPLYS